MLNSIEHEILNIKNNTIILIKSKDWFSFKTVRVVFILLINVNMITIVGFLTFMLILLMNVKMPTLVGI